jgi:hypothetical protein
VNTLLVTDVGGGVRFSVRVQPRSSRERVDGVFAGAVRIRLTAPPVDGAANDALIAFLSGALGVAARAVRIVRGATSRTKLVEVSGVTSATVRGWVGEHSGADAPARSGGGQRS